MRDVTAEVVIDRQADEVFAFLSDFENNPTWQRGMRSARWTSEGPIGVGSTYDQEAEFLGRPVTNSFEVTAYDPGRSISIRSTSGTFPIQVTRTVEPLGEGRARVTARIGGDASGFSRLLSPVLRWMVQRSVAGDYRRLKQALEPADR